MKFCERLSQPGILLLDGAMGTELARRGINLTLPLWSASAVLYVPETVIQIHADYLAAGADIITTTTFRTDRHTFTKAGLAQQLARQACFSAVHLAQTAINKQIEPRRVFIAGSMAPLEDCYHPELGQDYNTILSVQSEKAAWLAEAGVDFLLIETMNNKVETLATTQAALQTGLPVITSCLLRDADHLFDGTDIKPLMFELFSKGITAFALNCFHHTIISEFLNRYLPEIPLPLAVYPNADYYYPESGWQKDPTFTPANFARIALNWSKMGVKIIGGCCGTTPDHIHALHNLIIQNRQLSS